MIRIISFFLSFVTLISSQLGFSSKNSTVYRNIEYGDSIRNVMDIYVPVSAYNRKENAFILYLHGGSWSAGDKGDMEIFCKAMAKKGYITATMSYSLFTEENEYVFKIDTILGEMDLAIRQIKRFSQEKNLNIKKGAISGFSAGAHLAMLYTYKMGVNSAIPLVFTANKSGPADFSPEIWGRAGYELAGRLAGKRVTEEMINSGEAERIVDEVSPLAYVSKETVPSLFAYGKKDIIVPYKNAQAVKAKFEEAGAPFDFIVFPHSNHPLMADPACEKVYQSKLEEYCKTYFGY